MSKGRYNPEWVASSIQSPMWALGGGGACWGITLLKGVLAVLWRCPGTALYYQNIFLSTLGLESRTLSFLSLLQTELPLAPTTLIFSFITLPKFLYPVFLDREDKGLVILGRRGWMTFILGQRGWIDWSYWSREGKWLVMLEQRGKNGWLYWSRGGRLNGYTGPERWSE